jgi:hypothetical protein
MYMIVRDGHRRADLGKSHRPPVPIPVQRLLYERLHPFHNRGEVVPPSILKLTALEFALDLDVVKRLCLQMRDPSWLPKLRAARTVLRNEIRKSLGLQPK